MRGKTVILGGGPCGLSAAWKLAECGHEVVVIEREDRVGGLCRTLEHRGFRFDLGGHRFISGDPELIEQVKGLLGDDLLTAQRRSVIRWQGKDYQYPLALDDLLRKVPWGLGLRCLADLIRDGSWFRVSGSEFRVSGFGFRVPGFGCRKRRASAEAPATLEDWLIGRFGPTLYQTFFEPYTRKLWGLPPRELSADWAGQRIASLSLGEALARLLKLKNGHLRTYAPSFFYPKKGIGQIFETMAGIVEDCGGAVVLEATLDQVVVRDGRAQAVRFTRRGQTQELACHAVISTVPLPDLMRALRPAPPGIEEASMALRFRAVRFLNLLLEGEDISGNTWIYVSDEEHPMTRIQEPKRRSPFNAPPGCTSLILEIPCHPGDATWHEEEERLYEKGMTALGKLGIHVEDRVRGFFTSRAEQAYPVYTLGYARHRNHLLQAVGTFVNVLPCGRQGLFRYLFMDQAMRMGVLAARWAASEATREEVFALGLESSLVEAAAICP